MDINVATLRGIYTSLSTAFNVRFASVKPLYGIIAMDVPSTTSQNEYPRLDDMPGIREWVGERLIHRLGAQTYTIRNKSFEKTIAIKRPQIEDDQIGIFGNIAGQFGQDAASFPDKLVWPLLNNGDTTICYDGQYFFDTDHPGYDASGQLTSVANFVAGSGPAWYLVDDTQVVKPIVYQKRKDFKLTPLFAETDPNVFYRDEFVWGTDGRCNAGYGLWQLAYKSKATLNEANFNAARAAMQALRKADGDIINIRPTKILVPPALGPTARKLLNAELINGGESNTLAGIVEVVEVGYLS
jgi:phage major head subunit gpT-like protein